MTHRVAELARASLSAQLLQPTVALVLSNEFYGFFLRNGVLTKVLRCIIREHQTCYTIFLVSSLTCVLTLSRIPNLYGHISS